YGDYHPYYLYDWNYIENGSGDGYKVQLTMEQFQLENSFWMPIDIFIQTEEGEQIFTVENSELLQSYSFDIDSKPLSLVPDKNNWILCEKKEGISVINQDINNMILTVSSNGALGFDKPDGLGNGLIFPKGTQNGLFFGTLMIGDSPDFIIDNSEKDKVFDFAKQQESKINISYNDVSDFDINVKYDDSSHPFSKNIKVNQTSHAWFLVPYRNFIFIDYDIKNDGVEDLDSIYLGLFMDFDIGNYSENIIKKDESRNMIYQYNNGIYLGIKLLNSDTNNIVYSGIIDAIDNFSEEKKYSYLTGMTNNFQENKKHDWSSLLSAGPYLLNSGDSIIVKYALIGGISEENIKENADIAQNFYNKNFTDNTEIQSKELQNITVSPNPVSDKINFKINSESNQKATISIYDFTGKKMYFDRLNLTKGTNIYTLNKRYNQGVYFYKINFQNTKLTGKFCVNN
ncbi:MAG TPA: T9SS type A sorting domain-containing protein, partial [Bacteroidetes bacterium]|nr:T9SS type A sorting domain-containing protein [Bacteroidota bacterium]